MDSLKEFHRVLQPHGRLGLVWNVEDWNAPKNHKASTAWEKVAHELNFAIAEESGDDQPRFRHQEWRKVFDEQIKVTPLTILKASDDQLFSLPIGEHVEPFEVALPVEDAWKRFRTLGQISVIEGERLEVCRSVFNLCREQQANDSQRAKKTFMDAINGEDVEKNENGDVIIHGNSYAYWTSKIPAEGRDGVFSVEHSKE